MRYCIQGYGEEVVFLDTEPNVEDTKETIAIILAYIRSKLKKVCDSPVSYPLSAHLVAWLFLSIKGGKEIKSTDYARDTKCDDPCDPYTCETCMNLSSIEMFDCTQEIIDKAKTCINSEEYAFMRGFVKEYVKLIKFSNEKRGAVSYVDVTIF